MRSGRITRLALFSVVAVLAVLYILRAWNGRYTGDPRVPGAGKVSAYRGNAASNELLDSAMLRIVNMLRSGKFAGACSLADSLVHVRSLTADLAYAHGKCLLQLRNQPGDALAWLRRAREMGIAATDIGDLIGDAEKLTASEEALGLVRSVHFDLQVEDKVFTHGDRLLAEMETAYDSLCMRWRFYPESKIPAILYASKAYQGQEDLPDWTGALFDGKVRIPANVMEEWPRYRRIVHHEVAHAFHREMTGGKPLPTWLEEGLAQDFDGTALDMALIQDNSLQDSLDSYNGFLRIGDAREAHILYQHSLYRTRQLLERIGRDSLALWIRSGAN